ncbi:MAG: phenylalanine--tRNA ligase beta subunit-related protein [Ardenticatenia bacterium]|nr:phenylalanine--tRNA ligase beta subunit-related protein [Ardenticatenia bacterium]
MRVLVDGVDEAIFARFPEYVRAVVIAWNVDNTSSDPEIGKRLSEATMRAQQIVAQQGLTMHPHIVAWRKAYKAFGMWDGRSYSAVEALARRARSGKPVRRISPLVDLMNTLSLLHFVPVGGDDVEQIQGNVTLRPATGAEVFVPFNSEEHVFPPAGEVVYVDDAGRIMCRKWNWRQGRFTAITPQTSVALCNVDVLPPLSRADGALFAAQLAEWIEVFLGGQTATALITASTPQVELTCPL